MYEIHRDDFGLYHVWVQGKEIQSFESIDEAAAYLDMLRLEELNAQ